MTSIELMFELVLRFFSWPASLGGEAPGAGHLTFPTNHASTPGKTNGKVQPTRAERGSDARDERDAAKSTVECSGHGGVAVLAAMGRYGTG